MAGRVELACVHQPKARRPSEGSDCLISKLCRRGDCVQRWTVRADSDASDQLPPGKLPRAQLKKTLISSKLEKTRALESVFNRSAEPSPHT